MHHTGLTITQTVSRRLLNTKSWVRSQGDECGTYGGQSGTRKGFFPSPSVFPSMLHIHSYHLGNGQWVHHRPQFHIDVTSFNIAIKKRTLKFNISLLSSYRVYLWFITWFSELIAIISINSINKLIPVMVTPCIFFKVRTEYLSIIQIKGKLRWPVVTVYAAFT
jgi:hypothetical protein